MKKKSLPSEKNNSKQNLSDENQEEDLDNDGEQDYVESNDLETHCLKFLKQCFTVQVEIERGKILVHI